MITTHPQNFMAVVLLCALACLSMRADDDVANEYRLTIALHNPRAGD